MPLICAACGTKHDDLKAFAKHQLDEHNNPKLTELLKSKEINSIVRKT